MSIVWTSQWTVSGVLGAGVRNKKEVIVSEKFSPTGLSTVEYFGRHEASQISMI